MSWHNVLKQTFLLANFTFFCYKVKIADVKKVWKPVTAMGRSPSVLPGAMELRTKWLVWWRLLLKGRLLSRTKVPGSSREWCFEEQNRLKMGYSAGPNIPPHSVHSAFKTALLSRNATMLLSADLQPSLSLFHFQCPLGCESQADPPTPAGSQGLRVSSPQGVYSRPGSPATQLHF